MTQTVRRSVIAGSWYPGTESRLARTVDAYLQQVQVPELPGDLVGLIVPHAGYAYSGPTAAHAYRMLEGTAWDTVAILGPSHRAWVGEWVASAEDAYQTPLGRVPVDHAFLERLSQRVELSQIQRDNEHSLEIQLPFLQRVLPEGFRLAPLMMSADTPAAAQRLAAALADSVRQDDGQVLLVASSDLHHIEGYSAVKERDAPIVEAIDDYDLARLEPLLMLPGCSVCGRIPILTVLYAAHSLGADQVTVLHHTNSGDVTGERERAGYVVGYLAAAITKPA
jgi:AmmeMemoRadiSam system protein B